MKAHRLQDLQIWQKSILLVKEVYLLTENLPADEKYGLVSQIKRCAVSILQISLKEPEEIIQKNFINFRNSSRVKLRT